MNSPSKVEVFGNDSEGDCREKDEELGTKEDLLEVGEEAPEEAAGDFGDQGQIRLLAEGRRRHVVSGATVSVPKSNCHRHYYSAQILSY